MEILEAIQKRHSVRAFLPRPVPKETVMQILAAATRSPSGSNSQPWEVFVAAGQTIEKIRAAYQERLQTPAAAPVGPVTPPRPPLPDYIQRRMTFIRQERMQLLGLDPADPASGKVFLEMGARLYDAPVMAIICMDKALNSHLDIGLFIQTLCLAAQAFGVDTLIAQNMVAHPDILRRELEIPESLNIITGVGLGYPDPQSVINTYRSPRRSLEEVVRYKG
jgi:nitroreductase